MSDWDLFTFTSLILYIHTFHNITITFYLYWIYYNTLYKLLLNPCAQTQIDKTERSGNNFIVKIIDFFLFATW